MWEKIKRNPIVYLVLAGWRCAEGSRLIVVLYLTMSLIATIVWTSSPLVLAALMNRVQTLHGDTLLHDGGWLLVALAALGLIGWLFHGPSRVMETRVAFSVRRRLLTRLVDRALQLPVRWHQQHHSGKTIDQINRASSALSEFCEVTFDVLGLSARFLGAAIMLTWFMPQAGVVALVGTVVVVGTIAAFDRVLVVKFEATNARYNEVAALVQDFLSNVFTVISLRVEDRVVREVADRTESIRPLVTQAALLNESKWFATSAIIDLVRTVVLFGYLVVCVENGDAVLIGTFYALSEYLRTLGESFYQFTMRYGDLLVKATRVQAAEHIDEAYEREIGEKRSTLLPESWRSISVEGITFQHEHQQRPALDGVTLTFTKGKAYAFVGESGSGKSTLLAVLRGLHQNADGLVFADGYVVEGGLRAIAHHTTLIPQDPEIFDGSVRFNVTMGVSASDDEVMRVLRLARFLNVLKRLPNGLDTSVAEKGVTLSGGERQRLALARGLFFAADAASEIVLFDESTSSVDLVNEREIFAHLLSEMRDKVVISAVHKFNLLHFFDHIVVMEGGKVAEHGCLEDLLSRNGSFAAMWGRYAADSGLAAVG